MTKEDKDLLLKDLCARLPYKVMVQDDMGRIYKLEIGNSYLIDIYYGNGDYTETPIKPYLRPLSSMTEDEMLELSTALIYARMIENTRAEIDWLNAHHFDYNGLIEKGLAIAVTDENNPYKD